jgi:hypothetical protein
MIEFALDALDCRGIDFVPRGNCVNNRLKRFSLRLESERVVQTSEAQFRFKRDIERAGGADGRG